MNEQIRELAEQAGLGKERWNTTEQFNSFLAKFAESIVRECASICEVNGDSYKYSFTPTKALLAESTSVYCGTLIKKHFGVSE